MSVISKFTLLVEKLGRERSIIELQKALDELKGKDITIKNIEKSLKKVAKVLNNTKQDVLNREDILTMLKLITDQLTNLKVEITELDTENKQTYDKIFDLVKGKTFDTNLRKKVAAEAEKLVKETEPKLDAISKKTDEVFSKLNSLFPNWKESITSETAPILSQTLIKNKLPEVQFLQVYLNEKGHFSTNEKMTVVKLDDPNTDGIFGPRTTAAVKDFQAEKGLKADGIVGTSTWTTILKDLGLTVKPEFKADAKYKDLASKSKDAVNINKDIKTAASKLGITKLPSQNVSDSAMEEVVKVLVDQKMSDKAFNSDENLIFETLVKAFQTGTINPNSVIIFLNKYKNNPSTKKGLFSDLFNCFDTPSTQINNSIKKIVEQILVKNTDYVKAKSNLEYSSIISEPFSIMTIPTFITKALKGELSGQTEKIAIIYTLFGNLGNEEVNKYLKVLGINVDMIAQLAKYNKGADFVAAQTTKIKV